MSQESVVEINGHQYRYQYNPDTGKTEYVGPVGDAPIISEAEFLAAMEIPPGFNKVSFDKLVDNLIEKTQEPKKKAVTSGDFVMADYQVGRLNGLHNMQLWDSGPDGDDIDAFREEMERAIKNTETRMNRRFEAVREGHGHGVGNIKRFLLVNGELHAYYTMREYTASDVLWKTGLKR